MTNSNSKIASRRQHNPPSSIPKVFTDIPKGLKETDKCKLYIILQPTPNDKSTLQCFHGVQLKNINRVLSKRNKANQQAAFFTIAGQYDASGTTHPACSRTFKIFN